ncbi:undecaprenyl-diphosphate phosphatase [Planctomycetota bacterium]|jgi:undecaprenyl-diphosphatase|nr:undecaprenyl-diphosphate phosphatase [Planctomycetota bacterium]
MLPMIDAAMTGAAAVGRTAAQGVQDAAGLAEGDVWNVFFLAIIQGLTEFLPVSSSGHLVLGKSVMGLETGGLALDVALHLGTLGAIVWAFRRDVLSLLRDPFEGRYMSWVWLVVATLPVAVIGLVFKDSITAAAGTVFAAGCGLLVTSVALMVGEFSRRKFDAPAAPTDGPPPLRLRDAVVMGLAQAAAIWPGVSRSGSTISAGLIRGLSAEDAARLSFLMSIPAISGAAIVELPSAISEGFGELNSLVVLGAAVLAGLVGWSALRMLLLVLRKGSFPYFAGYCAVLGTVALIVGG